MSQYTVLFDANVLYPAPMRDASMPFCAMNLIGSAPRWSEPAI
jgi:hypothetical protein